MTYFYKKINLTDFKKRKFPYYVGPKLYSKCYKKDNKSLFFKCFTANINWLKIIAV